MVACELGFLIAADLVGVAMSFFFDTFGGDSTSTALFYAIWFVVGVFCGLLIYLTAGAAASPPSKDWTTQPRARRTAWLVILTTALILTALAVTFYRLQWRLGVDDGVFVPDSEPLTLTFFITILVSMIFFDHVSRSRPSQSK